MWDHRGYCNFTVRVVQDPTHPWPSFFSSKKVSKIADDDSPPIISIPFPSGDGAKALAMIP